MKIKDKNCDVCLILFNLKKKGERIATFPLEKIFGKDNIFASMISNVIGTVGKAIEGIASNVQKGNSYIIDKYLFFPFSYIYIYIKYLVNILLQVNPNI